MSKENIEMKHLIHAFTPIFFQPCTNIFFIYTSLRFTPASQRDYICSLGLFMNSRCMLIPSTENIKSNLHFFYFIIIKKFVRNQNVCFGMLLLSFDLMRESVYFSVCVCKAKGTTIFGMRGVYVLPMPNNA